MGKKFSFVLQFAFGALIPSCVLLSLCLPRSVFMSRVLPNAIGVCALLDAATC